MNGFPGIIQSKCFAPDVIKVKIGIAKFTNICIHFRLTRRLREINENFVSIDEPNLPGFGCNAEGPHELPVKKLERLVDIAANE